MVRLRGGGWEIIGRQWVAYGGRTEERGMMVGVNCEESEVVEIWNGGMGGLGQVEVLSRKLGGTLRHTGPIN